MKRRYFMARKNGRAVRVYFRDLGDRAAMLYITRYECEGQVMLSGFDAAVQRHTAERRFAGDVVVLSRNDIELDGLISIREES